MDPNQQKEQFSNAHLRAVVAVAGYGVYKPEPDEDSVDWGIAARGGGGSFRSPRLELQLKCAATDLEDGPVLRYRLKLKNYNDLRVEDLLVPRILVLVRVPEQMGDWLRQSEDEMALRHCGYWVSLRGRPETANASTVTIEVPRSQVFSVAALQGLMSRISAGDVP
jgi:hypothetical protein